MSNSENNEASVLKIVEVESNTATSTSTNRIFNEDSDTSSEESVGSRVENETTSLINEAIFVVPSVQASTNLSFDNLTIPVAIPLDPRISRTTYAGVTTTGLTIRDVPDPSVLNRDFDDSNTLEDVPKTKKRLPGDFFLKNNTLALSCLLFSLT